MKKSLFCVTDGDFYYNSEGGMYMKVHQDTVHEYTYSSKEEAEKVLSVLKEKMYNGKDLKLTTIDVNF